MSRETQRCEGKWKCEQKENTTTYEKESTKTTRPVGNKTEWNRTLCMYPSWTETVWSKFTRSNSTKVFERHQRSWHVQRTSITGTSWPLLPFTQLKWSQDCNIAFLHHYQVVVLFDDSTWIIPCVYKLNRHAQWQKWREFVHQDLREILGFNSAIDVFMLSWTSPNSDTFVYVRKNESYRAINSGKDPIARES